ncbi:MAG TPA: tyrosine-type recombinase/integrase [Actinomycetota bacterium]|jgi:integrase|nr:tyrosine-type recombinase/integrase [Actinomycetota bacterium]
MGQWQKVSTDPRDRGIYKDPKTGTLRVFYQLVELANGKRVSKQRTKSFPKGAYTITIDAETGATKRVTEVAAARRFKRNQDDARRAGRTRNVDEEAMTLSEYFERWMGRPSKRTGKRRRSSTDENSYRPTFRKWIAPVFGDEPVRSITKGQVLDWDAWVQAEAGPAARNKAVRILRAVLKAAEIEFDDPPFLSPARVLSDAVDKVRAIMEDELLTDEQITTLRTTIDPRYAVMIDLLANGLRIGEVCGLRKIDVNLKGDVQIRRQVVEVRGRLVEGPPKTENSNRALPLLWLRDEIQRHIGEYARSEPDGYAFTSARGDAPVSPSNWRDREFFPALERAKLPRITPHYLRHRCAWDLLDRGFSPAQIADWLGDTEGMVLRVYANHPLLKSKDAIATHLGERYREANGHTAP